MRYLKPAFYADLAVSLVLLAAVLVWKLLVRGEEPGFLVIGLAAMLIVNSALCLYSAAAIGRGRGRTAAKLWLFISTLIFSYALADFTGGLILHHAGTEYNVADGYSHHRLRPNVSEEMRNSSDFDAVLTTNGMGFRNREIGEKKPGVYRIVMLGDSFTMGEGVRDDQTFPYLAERYLNGDGGGKYEVVNLGIESYSPVLEYLLLKKYIGVLKPDMVVLNFDMSDLRNESYYRSQARYDKEGDVTAVDGVREYEMRSRDRFETAYIWIRDNLALTNGLIGILEGYFGSETEMEHRTLLVHTLDAPQPVGSAESYRMAEDGIMRAKRLCDEHRCAFVLSVYPWGHQVNGREWVPGRYDYIPEGARISDRTVDELGRFAAKNGIDFFNAFPVFRAYDGGEPLYFRHDPHWTPAGQRLMAETLAGFIEEKLKTANLPHDGLVY